MPGGVQIGDSDFWYFGSHLKGSIMNYGKKILTAAAIATALSATSASALTTTIDFGNANSGPVGSLVFTKAGFTVTASASTTDNARNVIDAGKVTQTKHTTDVNGGGLGVLNATGDSNHDIDGAILRNDLLNLKFNKAVKLKSVRFARVDSNDVFDFWLSSAYTFSAATPFPLAQYVFAGTGAIGSLFGFGATADTSDYKIRSVTVSAVPLPPAAMLLITGLFGIGALGRRRSKSA
jgi:hypothetical protein